MVSGLRFCTKVSSMSSVHGHLLPIVHIAPLACKRRCHSLLFHVHLRLSRSSGRGLCCFREVLPLLPDDFLTRPPSHRYRHHCHHHLLSGLQSRCSRTARDSHVPTGWNFSVEAPNIYPLTTHIETRPLSRTGFDTFAGSNVAHSGSVSCSSYMIQDRFEASR